MLVLCSFNRTGREKLASVFYDAYKACTWTLCVHSDLRYGKVCFFFEEAAILETHGLDVQSPGGHSNSDEIDGNDFSEPGAEPGLGTVRTAFNSTFQNE